MSVATSLGVGHVLPLEVMDKCIGSKVWIVMRGEKEFYGTLRGFDEYLNIIMDDVKEYEYAGQGSKRMLLNEVESMLLNGSHICIMIPGDNPPPKASNE